MTWILYGLGIGLAGVTGWWLRGLREEDRAHKAMLEKIALEREANRKWVKPQPKDYPYP